MFGSFLVMRFGHRPVREKPPVTSLASERNDRKELRETNGNNNQAAFDRRPPSRQPIIQGQAESAGIGQAPEAEEMAHRPISCTETAE